MEPLAPGDPRQVGAYRLHALLGAGGMGRVFLGFSPAGKAVAVKIVHPEFARDPEFVQRFRREVRAAEAVSGAYTAPVVAVGPDDYPPWLATAYVAGPSLADLIEQTGPLPEAAVWRLAGGLVEALQAVHARGLVHRDLKPTNVLLAVDGPRVIDFGISRALQGTALTASSVIVGTPGFMSPEQAQGLPVGFPSDVFALGSLIAFAATGAGPFGSGDLVATAYRIVHAEPDLGGIRVLLRNLVASCLAKAPADRPPLTRLLDAVMAESAFYPGVSPTNFWPEPVAGLIRSSLDSFRTQVASHVGSDRIVAMPSLPHEPTAPARAGSSEDGEEVTRTAVGVSGVHVDPLGSFRSAETGAINRVPRTEAERQQLLLERPIGWEFLYFAARLLNERNAVERKYRDYLMGYAVPGDKLVSFLEAVEYIDRVLHDSLLIVGDLERIMNDDDAKEHAFGAQGEDGDPEAIADLAKSMNIGYEKLMDSAAEVRGTRKPSEFDRYFELVASSDDSAISSYRKFVDDVVAYNDRFPAQIAAGDIEESDFTLRLTVSDETQKAIAAEADRIKALIGAGRLY